MEELFKIRIEIIGKENVVIRETQALNFNPRAIPRSGQPDCFDMAIDLAIREGVGINVKQAFRRLHALADLTGPLPPLPPPVSPQPNPIPTDNNFPPRPGQGPTRPPRPQAPFSPFGGSPMYPPPPPTQILGKESGSYRDIMTPQSPSPPRGPTYPIKLNNQTQIDILKNTLVQLEVTDYILEDSINTEVGGTPQNLQKLGGLGTRFHNFLAIYRIPVIEKPRIRYKRIDFHGLHPELYTKLLLEIQDQLINNPRAKLPQMADISLLVSRTQLNIIPGGPEVKYKDLIVETFNPILYDRIFSKQIFLKERRMLTHLETILRDVRDNIELLGYQGLNEYRVWADIKDPGHLPETIQDKIRRMISPLHYSFSKYLFHEGIDIAQCKEISTRIQQKYPVEIEVRYGSKKIFTDGKRKYRYRGKKRQLKEEMQSGIMAYIESLNIDTIIHIERKLDEKSKNCIVKQELYLENFITKGAEKKKLGPMGKYNAQYSVLENIQRELGGKFEMIEEKVFFEGKISQIPRATERILELLYEFTMETIDDIKFPESLLAQIEQPDTGKSLIQELEDEFRCRCTKFKSGVTSKNQYKLEISSEKRANVEDFKKEYFRRGRLLAIYNKPTPFIKNIVKEKIQTVIEYLNKTFGVIVTTGKPPWVICGPSEYSVTEALAKYIEELTPTKVETIKHSISVDPINYGAEIVNRLKSSGILNDMNVFVHVNRGSKSIDLSSKLPENIQKVENIIYQQMSKMKAQIKEIKLSPKISYFLSKNWSTWKSKTGIFAFIREYPLIYIYFAKSEKKVEEEVKEGITVRNVKIGVWYFHVWDEKDINYARADAWVEDKRYKLFNEVHQEQLNRHYQRWIDAGQPKNYERRLYQDKDETIPGEYKAVLDPDLNNWYEVNIKYNKNKRHLARGEKTIKEPIPLPKSTHRKEPGTLNSAVIRGPEAVQIQKVMAELNKLVQNQEEKEVQINLNYGYSSLPATERQKIRSELSKIYVKILGQNANGVVIGGLNIGKSKYILESYENSIKKYSYPKEWENTVELDNKKATLYRLQNSSQEFRFCYQELVATLPNARIISVDRIQSKRLWKKYEDERLQLSETRGEDDPTVQQETLLFHGTGIYIYIYIYR